MIRRIRDIQSCAVVPRYMLVPRPRHVADRYPCSILATYTQLTGQLAVAVPLSSFTSTPQTAIPQLQLRQNTSTMMENISHERALSKWSDHMSARDSTQSPSHLDCSVDYTQATTSPVRAPRHGIYWDLLELSTPALNSLQTV